MPDAARIVPIDSPFAARNMRGRLEKLFGEKLALLVGAHDWADFKKRTGELQALSEAMRICDELDQNERGN